MNKYDEILIAPFSTEIGLMAHIALPEYYEKHGGIDDSPDSEIYDKLEDYCHDLGLSACESSESIVEISGPGTEQELVS